jgi:hypothetical protein
MSTFREWLREAEINEVKKYDKVVKFIDKIKNISVKNFLFQRLRLKDKPTMGYKGGYGDTYIIKNGKRENSIDFIHYYNGVKLTSGYIQILFISGKNVIVFGSQGSTDYEFLRATDKESLKNAISDLQIVGKILLVLGTQEIKTYEGFVNNALDELNTNLNSKKEKKVVFEECVEYMYNAIKARKTNKLSFQISESDVRNYLDEYDGLTRVKTLDEFKNKVKDIDYYIMRIVNTDM